MTDAVIVFGRGRLFHCYRFPEVDGCPIEESRAHVLIRCNLHIRTNSRIERWCKFTMHYARNEEERKRVIDVLCCEKLCLV